ncbi:MAG TPA: TolC family protein [Blastocatellia bacterium]|nr:TolC family protein [Blastocatellia bacterium]
MRYTGMLLTFFCLVVVQVNAQFILPAPLASHPAPPASDPAPPQKTTVPRQLTMEKAEEVFLQNNLALVASRYGVDAARAAKLFASLKPNPTLSVSAEQFKLKDPLSHLITDSGTAANRFYTVKYDQIIEMGGKRRLRTEAADFQLKAAEAQLLDALRQQKFQLKQAFYNAVLARENFRVATENLSLANSTEHLIKVHVDTGDSPQWDLIKFQAGKVQFQQDLETDRLQYQQAVRDLYNVMGVQTDSASTTVPVSPASSDPTQQALDAQVDVMGDLNVVPVNVSISSLEDAALRTRPDVLAAQRNAEASQRLLQLAKALRSRDLDLGWEYQRNGGDDTFGFTFSVPLFIHNNHQAEIDQAAAQVKQAETILAQTRLQALTDVNKAYTAYETSQRLLRIYSDETVARAQESLKIANVSYTEGATSLLELQDAGRTYNQTRVAYNQAHFNYLMSLYQLELATGTTLIH